MTTSSGPNLSTRFEIEKLIGRGAFGEVYRAIDRETGTLVAIKRLAAHLTDPVVAERFDREARILSRIDNPHVVRYIAHGSDAEDRPILVLEWLDGEDLARRQARDPLSYREAVEVVRQAALGLAGLHDEGVIHRDLKPSNFFLAGAGDSVRTVKLIDLGIARALNDGALTLEGLRIGTPGYMSPEQARGEEIIGFESDLFSLGVVLYELLTGRRPFTGSDPFAVLAKIVLEEPASVRALVPSVPADLDAIVSRAMSKRPDARFPSARQFALALVGVSVSGSRPPSGKPDAATAQLRSGVASQPLERRVVTVVFAVLAAGPTLDRDRDTFRRIANEHGATVHRMLGRRMIAVFGALRSHGDEAVRAARAAMSTIEQTPTASVAIATGRAIAGSAALSGGALDRGALDATRPPGTVWVDPVSARLLSPFFVVTGDGDAMYLRGERDPAHNAATRLLGRETPTLGREREIELLEDGFLAAAREHRVAVVNVEGPPGIGKSRLRFELVKRLSLHDLAPRIVVVRGDPMWTDTPLGMLARALASEAAVERGVPIDNRREAVRQWLRDIGSTVDPALAGEVLHVEFPDEASERLRVARQDPATLRATIRDTLGDLLRDLSRAAPLVLVIEDAQWADVATIESLGWALDACRAEPIFVVSFGRPEVSRRFPSLWAALDPANIELRPLSSRACDGLVRAVLGEAADEATMRAIVTRSMGNPLFLEELLRARQAGDEGDLPMAVQAAIQIRLDGLPADARRVVQVGSILGMSVWREALERMAPGIDVAGALNTLVAEEVLAQRPRARFGRASEYVFRHGLLREAAYAMIAPEESARLHFSAAQWLRAAGEDDDAILAQHYERAGEMQLAAERYLSAARRAWRDGAFETVLSHADRGLACGATAAVRAPLHQIGAQAAHPLGRYDVAMRHAEQGLEIAEDVAVRLDIAASAGLTQRRLGDLAGAREILSRALEAEGSRGGGNAVRRARLAVQIELAWALYHSGEFDRAMDAARDALVDLPEEVLGVDALVLSAMHVLARARHSSGDLLGALGAHRACIERASSLGHRWRSEGARNGLGDVLLALGRFADARAELDTSCHAARTLGLMSTLAYGAWSRSVARAALGDAQGARADIDEALAIGARLRAPALRGGALACRAWMLHRSGDLPGAMASARAALEVASTPTEWRLVAQAQCVFGPDSHAVVDQAFVANGLAAAMRGAADVPARIAACFAAAALEHVGRHSAARSIRDALNECVQATAARLDGAERDAYLRGVEYFDVSDPARRAE